MIIPGAVSEAQVTHGKSSPTGHLPAPLGSFLYVTQERFWHLSFIDSPGYSVPWMSQARTLELLPFPCHFLLQAIIPTQGSNPCLLHLLFWQADSSALNPREAHGQHTNSESLAGAPM